MNENLDFISWATELTQSQTFGNDYKDILIDNETSAFNTPFFKEVDEIFNNILLENNRLSEFQKLMLYKIFSAFSQIREFIDPNRLKSFEYYFNDDNELLLFRKSEKGLTNIIINPEECIAYSFIGIDKKRILNFWYGNDDFESLAYAFFTN